MKTFIVTNAEDGWDCVVGAFEAETEKEVKQYIIDWCLPDGCIVHETTLTKLL